MKGLRFLALLLFALSLFAGNTFAASTEKSKSKKYSVLLDELITLAIKDYKNRTRKVYSFESNILSNYGIKGSKGLKK